MPFVVDASVTAAWCLRDETATAADAALDRLLDDEAVAPSLWWFEVRNILVVSERRGRIEPADTDTFLSNLVLLPIRIEAEPNDRRVVALARKHGLTAYDAAYLELALRHGAPISTLDRALAGAARAEGLDFVG